MTPDRKLRIDGQPHQRSLDNAVKCPLCGRGPCEILGIIDTDSGKKPEPTIHVRCPECLAEFNLTILVR